LAGLDLAVDDINEAGGVGGRPLELIVRDTAGESSKAATAVAELAALDVAAIVGEFHSVAARTAATTADRLGLPFLCSSAVLDALTEQPSDWVARLAPPQSRGWQVYAEFLVGAGHRRVAVAIAPSIYWTSGVRILRDHLQALGAAVIELNVSELDLTAMCNKLAAERSTILLLLVGHPDPVVSIVRAVRRDQRLAGITLGAPAGQPEFSEWATLLGYEGAAIPFLRYLSQSPNPTAGRVEATLRARLDEPPCFVAFEGYDAITVLAEAIRSAGPNRQLIAKCWQSLAVEGTRGRIQFTRIPGLSVWQWADAPIQIVDRDPLAINRFRVLHPG
jgi:ABC-type branched-subunit amino acid transport system substrate-binding protein